MFMNRPGVTINNLIKRDVIQRFMKQHSPITPRLICFRDAPFYLGMDRNCFNA